jgi:hypothetical protein
VYAPVFAGRSYRRNASIFGIFAGLLRERKLLPPAETLRRP